MNTIPPEYQGVLRHSHLANTIQISAAKRFIQRKFGKLQTEDGIEFSPRAFAEHNQIAMMPFKYSTGLLLFQARHLGEPLFNAKGERII